MGGCGGMGGPGGVPRPPEGGRRVVGVHHVAALHLHHPAQRGQTNQVQVFLFSDGYAGLPFQ